MEGVSARQKIVGAQAQAGEGQLTSYLEGRKVELMRDVTRAIFNNGLPIDCYIDTLIEASKLSKLSAVSCSDEEKVLFGLWYHGDYCPSEYPQRIGDRIVTLKCFCEKAHRDYPSQKVGGVYDENKRLYQEKRKKKKDVSSNRSRFVVGGM
ncbi:hypothetical protein GCM10023116_16480 [Kistimonas scapharcae]|uniref:Uncharacterized protein n=1 Tax=Kistimonas scapharcae TaxID=1036133 RepID=A0ABP8V064_9GAMM